MISARPAPAPGGERQDDVHEGAEAAYRPSIRDRLLDGREREMDGHRNNRGRQDRRPGY